MGQHPELAELLDPISRGEAVDGMEALAPVLVDELALVLHELPAGSHVVLCDPERVRTRSVDLVRTSHEFLDASGPSRPAAARPPSTWPPRRCATSRTSRTTPAASACRGGASPR